MGIRDRPHSSTFSLTQFLTDLTNSNPHANLVYVPALGRETLYSHQISLLARSQPNAPYALEPRSIFVSGICDTETNARKVFVRLTDARILDNGLVRTSSIDGKRFAHQIKCLTVSRQRDLVELLFWWEEECMRLRKLLDGEQELGNLIKQIETGNTWGDPEAYDDERRLDLEKLKFERERLRMRVRQRPSERREDIEADQDKLFEKAQRVDQHWNATGGPPGGRNTQPMSEHERAMLPPYRA